jgi:hypothetical protein
VCNDGKAHCVTKLVGPAGCNTRTRLSATLLAYRVSERVNDKGVPDLTGAYEILPISAKISGKSFSTRNAGIVLSHPHSF